MSEFKYACPVCGQHIKCDSSQAGTQMQCPTCFQKIIVPQAPAEEQKLILTGAKVGERPPIKTPEAIPYVSTPAKSISGVVAVLIIFAGIAAAVAFVYRGTIFKSPSSPPPIAQNTQTNSVPEKKQTIPPAPPASDSNWTLDLTNATIPASDAAGRLNGFNFICKHATFSNGSLTLRDGDIYYVINFNGAKPEALAGKTFDVTTNHNIVARVILRWKVGPQAMRESFTNDYAMLLNFGDVTNKTISGSIYLCTKDIKKSYVAGAFKAEIRPGKPKNE